MSPITTELKFVLNFAKVQTMLSRRFDNGLGGLGLNEFIILYHLTQADDEKMRRIDLAEKIGLTASGITRLLLPMEKIGLVKREAESRDARVSYVTLAPGGKRKLNEALERAELLAEELLPTGKTKKIEDFSDLLVLMGGVIK